MRVTDQMIASTILSNLNNNEKRLLDIQNKLSSGHNIARPSDDPVVAARVMGLNTGLDQNKQYQKNISDAQAWLQTTDQALDNIGSALQRARQLTMQGINGTLSDTDRQAVAQEIDQLIQNVVDNANTNFGGRYIFGGTMTTEKPFQYTNTGNATQIADGIYYYGNQDPLNWEIGQGVQIAVNTVGASTRSDNVVASIAGNTPGGAPDNNLFATLVNIKNDLNNSDTGDLETQLQNLDKNIDNILSLRSVVGAKENRLQAASDQASAGNLNLTSVLSNLYDVDLAKTYTDFSTQQNAYQAALNVAARIIQPSLVDFLK